MISTLCIPTERGEPPEFMFKDYHEALAVEVQTISQQTQQQVSPQQQNGRKTRNSNGSRGARAGLRSGKNYNKSDTDEEEGLFVCLSVCLFLFVCIYCLLNR